MANLWICFEDFIPSQNSLEVVRASHKGPLYNMTKVFDIVKNEDPNADDTSPLYEAAAKDGRMPRLPDIQKEREKWDLLSFPLNKGDVTVFHPGCLHGGAPVDADCPERHTLVLRFFGDKCFYRPRPVPESYVAAGLASQSAYDASQLPGSTGKVQPGDLYAKVGGGNKWTRCAGPGLQEAVAKL